MLPLGGQNPLEAFAVGKPVLLGPHTFNFAQVCDEAIAAGAALRLNDARALLCEAAALLGDQARCREMGAKALAFSQLHRGATQRTMALLQPLISASE